MGEDILTSSSNLPPFLLPSFDIDRFEAKSKLLNLKSKV